MIERKKPNADLRRFYGVLYQLGLIIALVIFIAAVRFEFRSSPPDEIVLNEQEIVEMEEIIQTRQMETPPPPPRPPVPVEVPNDEIIEDIDINIDADLSLDGPLNLPPPPPPAEDEEDFFTVVENMPELIGGLAGLQSSITYPEMARKAGIEGRVFLQFIVNERGEVENPRVIRGIGGGCDEEALKAIQKAKFKPGLQRGRPVRVQYNLPVVFKLQN
ncbi:MAG: energy transducer TonB [Rhodothermaeota bacterium MED-G64]|nr:MAG: energy transducer TonB [Rhodothermaeota bacterium MED-G64]HBD42815.1 energy transducer TonB [Bacteroidota bacterium]|tara:strand:- start:87 stop:737 length:651 start_codon:yes stop_codon:yes gene_type:complete